MDNTTADVCYRCGYNLVGIADERPCPECGLLAERSRRVTDELHQTRPRWLRRLSWGVWLILIAIVAPLPLSVAASHAEVWIYPLYSGSYLVTVWYWTLLAHLHFVPLDIAAAILSVGVLLLTSREGYPPADLADARLRRGIRLALLAPWTALVLLHANAHMQAIVYRAESQPNSIELVAMAVATLGCMPLPVLLAFRLRELAQRARSAHLAEHSIIVGVGVALTLIYVLAVLIVSEYSAAWGWGDNWINRGAASLVLTAFLGTLMLLFVLWALYLMIRFAIAFARAARNLRRQWREADRALIPATGL